MNLMDNEKYRSYNLNEVRVGTRIRALYDVTRYADGQPRTIHAGDVVTTILPTSNAGFRGIEVSVRDADGAAFYNVSTGAFVRA